MYKIKTPEGLEISVLSIYSSVGTDLQELLMDADNAARHEFAIVNDIMMPYAVQMSVMAGELYEPLIVGAQSLIQVDVIVFSDVKSEWEYLLARDKDNFFIHRDQFQNK